MISAPDIFRVGIKLPQVMDSPHGLIAFAVFASLSGLWLAKRFSVAKNIPGPPSSSFFTGTQFRNNEPIVYVDVMRE